MGCGSSSAADVHKDSVAVVEGILITPNEVKEVQSDRHEETRDFKTLLQVFKYCDPKRTGIISSKDRLQKALHRLARHEGLDVHDLIDFKVDGDERVNFPQFVDWARSKKIRLPMGLPEMKRSDSTISTMSTCFPLPPTWTGPKNNPCWNQRILINDDTLLADLQEFINLSYRRIWTRDRKATGINRVPNQYRLERVLRSENYKDWSAYYMKRRHLKSASTGAGFVQFQARTGTAANLCERHELEEHCNEWLLFHGTDKNAAEAICQTDFATALAGSATGTLYGKGAYFAESITKADEYAREDEEGVCCALVCRVVGGRVLYNHEAEPDANKLQKAVLSGAYDTILGDRENTRKTFREFVVFDTDQIYVEYVIFYRRVFSDIPGSMASDFPRLATVKPADRATKAAGSRTTPAYPLVSTADSTTLAASAVSDMVAKPSTDAVLSSPAAGADDSRKIPGFDAVSKAMDGSGGELAGSPAKLPVSHAKACVDAALSTPTAGAEGSRSSRVSDAASMADGISSRMAASAAVVPLHETAAEARVDPVLSSSAEGADGSLMPAGTQAISEAGSARSTDPAVLLQVSDIAVEKSEDPVHSSPASETTDLHMPSDAPRISKAESTGFVDLGAKVTVSDIATKMCAGQSDLSPVPSTAVSDDGDVHTRISGFTTPEAYLDEEPPESSVTSV